MKIEVIDNEGLRIDKYLSLKIDMSRSKIQKLIENDLVLVNNKSINSNYKVVINDIIEIEKNETDSPENLIPSDIKVDIIYENDDLLVINKPSGLVVHPAPGNYTDTLVNALIGKYQLSNNENRPGIVHRLDKDTSGLMLVAKNDFAHERLSSMIEKREVERYYIALVEGVLPSDTGDIDAPIGRDPKNRERMTVTNINSKRAFTHFKVLERYKNATLIECKLETGRTHQIRVHMKYIGHPVVNDPVYSKIVSFNTFGQLLHSYKIKFFNPRDGELLEFMVKPPTEFYQILNDYVIK